MIRFRKLAIAGVGCALIAITSTTSIANEDSKDTQKEAAIRQASRAYVEALIRGDGKALSALWTADGVYVDATGTAANAQELIKQHFGTDAPPVANDDVKVDPNSKIRFITPNVAIEEGSGPGSANGATGHYAAIWVNHGQGWRVASLREFGTGTTRSPLDALAWMIGDWVGKTDGSVVSMAADWSENRKFILRRFVVEQSGEKVLSGTQRIGWDPAAGKIRSWVFDSDGGITKGTWRSEGEAWIVKTTGVLPDGSESSAINFWMPEGPDRCVRKSSHVTIEGEAVEDSVIEFVRR